MTTNLDIAHREHVSEVLFGDGAGNVANVALLRALADALEALDARAECRAIVLRARGRVFCSGADLAASTGGGVGGTGPNPLGEFYEQALRLFGTRKPVIAAVQGAAVGAGLGLAVAADYRVAASEARFVANFTKLGFHPGFGLTHTLPQLIGAQRASLMFLTSRRVKAEDALAWGLIDELVPLDQIGVAAHRLAAEIAENAPLGLLATRRTLRAGLHEQVAAALAIEAAEQGVLRATADHAEGIRAVAERRAGRFVGR